MIDRIFNIHKATYLDSIFILAVTFFGIFFRGYEYGRGDQVHYLTFLQFRTNLNLYQNDYLMQQRDIPYTIFVTFLSLLPEVNGSREIAIFVLYIGFLCLFNYFIFWITDLLFRDKKANLLALLFLLPVLPIAGSGIETVERMLILRFVASVFFLWSVCYLLTKQWVLSSLVAGMGFLFHPLTLLPYPLIIMTLFTIKKLSFKETFKVFALFALITSPLFLSYIKASDNNLIIDQTWRQIIDERMPYIFVKQWSWIAWVMVLMVFLPFIVYKKFFPIKFHPVIITSIFSCVLLFSLNFFADIWNIKFLVQLQLTRSLYLVEILSLIFTAKIISWFAKRKKIDFAIIAVLIFCMSGFVAARNRTIDLPMVQPRDDFEKVAAWAKTMSSTDSVFLVPPGRSGFRFWSQRAVVTEYKEGADGLYSRDFALEWKRRQNMFSDYFILDDKRIRDIKKKIAFDYMVTGKGLSFPIVYENQSWVVYDLRNL